MDIGDPAAPLRAFFFVLRKFTNLFFVAVEAVRRRDGSEKSVLFVIDAGGEIQRVGQSGSTIIGKRERPKSIDGQYGIVWVLHEAHELVGEAVKRGDPPAAEIADKNGVAELTKIAGGPDHSPR